MKAGLRFLLFNLFLLISINIFPQSLWKEVFKQTQSNHLLNDIAFSDANTGIVVGQNGVILKTKDGGNSWFTVETEIKETFFSVSVADKNTMYVCGSNGTIIKSMDIGTTWKQLNTPTTKYLLKVIAITKDKVFAFGEDGIIIKTTDGGNSWQNIPRFSNDDIIDAQYIYPKTLFCVSGSSLSGGYLYKSVDTGNVWHKVDNNCSRPYRIHFLDTLTGFLCERFQNIYKTSDGGQFCTTIYTREGPTWRGAYKNIIALDTNNIFISNEIHGILKTTNGGRSWEKEAFDKNYIIDKVYFFNKDMGFALGSIGNYNVILKQHP